MAAFPSGSKTFFNQSTAPTGWTKATTNTNYTLRVVSGTPSAILGGTVDFSAGMVDTAFGGSVTNISGALNNDYADLPAHTHTSSYAYGTSFLAYNFQNYPGGAVSRFFTGTTYPGAGPGGGFGGTTGDGYHGHTLSIGTSTFNGINSASLSVNYVDFILATKD